MLVIIDSNHLNGKNEQFLKKENDHLRQEVVTLTDGIEAILEEIRLYKETIKEMQEDFIEELRDREKEHSKAHQLKNELSDAKAKLDNIKRQSFKNYDDVTDDSDKYMDVIDEDVVEI